MSQIFDWLPSSGRLPLVPGPAASDKKVVSDHHKETCGRICCGASSVNQYWYTFRILAMLFKTKVTHCLSVCRPAAPPPSAWSQPPDGVAPPPPWSPRQWAPRPPLGLQQSLVTSSDTQRASTKVDPVPDTRGPSSHSSHHLSFSHPTEKLTMFSEILPRHRAELTQWTETEWSAPVLWLNFTTPLKAVIILLLTILFTVRFLWCP